ncbi:hypothetical protein [Rhizobium herbae]|uniref:Uncharacterized protein n=1 Tax=Rhizobium herbae TaxID=508661 RepID=A0ABS4EWA5_9HYPH|nr:hypothetical protein [Rhizobium herbae]MBP1862203.1 hypothetical protein [Rhizobium herbae]
MNQLPSDATLAYVVNNGLLNKPDDWIAKVLGIIRGLPDERGPYCLRIGVTGTGHAPNYRIEPIHEPARTEEDLKSLDTPHWAYLGAINTAYSGRSHAIIVSGLDKESWSSKANTVQEVGALLLQMHRAPKKVGR